MIDKQSDTEGGKSKVLYDFIYEILETSGIPIEFFKYLESKYGVILFGGSVRDYIVFKGKYGVRDFDFVISGLENCNTLKELAEEYFAAFKWSYNQFGGVKIEVNDLTLDCWRLEDTYAFRRGKVKMDIEHLLDTPMLNIDRYAYNMGTMQYLLNCNVNTFPNEVDFNLYLEELLEINLVRALVYSKKYNLKLSPAIKLKMKEVINDEKRKKKMKDFQIYHYKEEKINLNKIEREIN